MIEDWRSSDMRQRKPQKTLKLQPFFEVVRSLLAPGDSLLDVGCGRGYAYMDMKWSNYLGIDLSEDEIRHAKKIHPGGRFLCRDLFEHDEPADVVMCARALIHIGPIEDAIRKLLSLSRKALCLFVLIGAEKIHRQEGGNIWYYVRTMPIGFWESFGKCRIIPANSYSTVVYD